MSIFDQPPPYTLGELPGCELDARNGKQAFKLPPAAYAFDPNREPWLDQFYAWINPELPIVRQEIHKATWYDAWQACEKFHGIRGAS